MCVCVRVCTTGMSPVSGNLVWFQEGAYPEATVGRNTGFFLNHCVLPSAGDTCEDGQ